MQSIKSKILNKLYQKKVASDKSFKAIDLTTSPSEITLTNPFNKNQSVDLPVNGLISVGGGALTGGLLSYLLSSDQNKLRNTILGTLTGAGLAGGGYYAYDRFLRDKTPKFIKDADKAIIRNSAEKAVKGKGVLKPEIVEKRIQQEEKRLRNERDNKRSVLDQYINNIPGIYSIEARNKLIKDLERLYNEGILR
jgi:hypothetical protein